MYIHTYLRTYIRTYIVHNYNHIKHIVCMYMLYTISFILHAIQTYIFTYTDDDY